MNAVLYGQNKNNPISGIFIFVLFFAVQIFGEFNYKHVPRLPDAGNEKKYDKKWEKYGAYYDKYDAIFTSFYRMHTAITRIEYFIKVKILTTKGAEYGTIPIYKYGERISHFEPHLYGPDGNEIKLNIGKLKKAYKESGKIVFPNVTKGCVASIRIEFLREHIYYSSWYEFIKAEIPIRVGRFIHYKSSTCKYDYKTYGNRHDINRDSYRDILTFTINEYEPKPDIDYLDYRANTEPRIMARLLNVYSWNKTFHKGKKIFRDYNNRIFGASSNIKNDGFILKVIKCIGGAKKPLKRAEKILKWVQDNVSYSRDADAFTDIINTETASKLQIACLCKEMFDQAGIQSNVVIVGHKDYYTIDKDFLPIDRYNYFTTPLLIAKINNKNYTAYPHERGYEFGEYPTSYNGVLCINPKEKKVQPLPAPKWGTVWIKDRMVLDISSFPGKYKLIREYKENSASDYREDLLGLDESALKGKFKDWLKDYKESNKLNTFKIINLDEYEKPLQVILHFENDDTPIPYENKQIFKLNNFFWEYFEDITQDRTEDVFIHVPTTYIDEIEILKIPGKKIEFDIKMEDVNSELFTQKFNKIETDSSYLFQRTLNLGVKHISKEKIKTIYNDCTVLNSIKNSSVIIGD